MAIRSATLNEREAAIRRVMDEWGVGRDAAALLLTIENGDAFIDDIVFESSDHPEVVPTTDRRPISDDTAALTGSSRSGPGRAPGRPRVAKD